jgi:hypothetical protein
MDFQLDKDVELSMDSFRSTFLHMSHLFVGRPLGTICLLCSFLLDSSTSFVFQSSLPFEGLVCHPFIYEHVLG